MKVIWDSEKEKKLQEERGISFEPFEKMILEKQYLAVLNNPVREGQYLFIFSYNGYTYAVPFLFDKDGNFVLKTAYRSRKYHKIYGEKNERRQT